MAAGGRGTLLSSPRVHSRPSGEGWGERWQTPSVTRPQGWKWHSPSCFWLGEDRVPYSDARKLCSDYGSTLVTITNRSVLRRWWWICPKTSPPGRGVTPTAGLCTQGLGASRAAGRLSSRRRPLSSPLQV